MKKRAIIALITLAVAITAVFGGCSEITERSSSSSKPSSAVEASAESKSPQKATEAATTEKSKQKSAASSVQSQAETELPTTESAASAYTMADIAKLKNTKNFAKKTLEHIFDGTINSKGNATGYHYSKVSDSKGKIISGTESKPDKHGVFTAKVKVNNVKKNGFSSFYPENWTPQQVVDAINEAYADALSDKSNPHGSLWIGYSGDLEIDMYLDSNKKITTAYPVYKGAKK